MKVIPPKLLAITEEKGYELLEKVKVGTATLEERKMLMKLVTNFQEVLAFIKNADSDWDNHVLELDYGWQKKKTPNKSK